jgi:hypothetical protein
VRPAAARSRWKRSAADTSMWRRSLRSKARSCRY